jgi:hypothetical protein
MFEHSDSTGCDFVTYELDADHFDLYPGDMLSPGSELGIDVRAGTIVYLESWGHVATVYYNPMNHSYLTMIHLARPQIQKSRLPKSDVAYA